MKELFVIDFSNFAYKYKNTLRLTRKLESGVSVDTSVLYGIARTIKTCRYDDILIVIDGYPKLFKEFYPEYKGQRSKEAEEGLQASYSDALALAYSIQDINGKRVRIVCAPMQEADQVISSIAVLTSPTCYPFLKEMYSKSELVEEDPYLKRVFEGWGTRNLNLGDYDRVVLGTSDSDMYQLLKYPHIFISTKTNGEVDFQNRRTPKAVKNLPPETIPAYKAIVGDISDNVPSAKGSMPLKEVMFVLNDALSEPADLIAFTRSLKSGLQPPKGTERLYRSIMDSGCRSQFLTNLRITSLCFYSVPLEMTPPSNFNLKELTSKFRIRI